MSWKCEERRLDELSALITQMIEEEKNISLLKTTLNKLDALNENNSLELRSLAAELSNFTAQVKQIEQCILNLKKEIVALSEKQATDLKTLHEEHDISEAKRQKEIRNDLQEIQSGDLFRRIEFLQTRIVILENLIQRNLLSPDAQKNSADYRYIQNIKSLFPAFKMTEELEFVRVGREHDGGYKIVLRLATMIGFLVALISLAIAAVTLVYKLLHWDSFPMGNAAISIGVFFFGAVQLFFIGLLGEYVLSINTRVLRRPLVIEECRVNFDTGKNSIEKRIGNEIKII